ncbi:MULTISPECIES: sulfite oxidase [Haloferax]|uniref:Molybdopterin-dependent oxidoreductase n=1 Tax=Haloferax marinum TaxID=2666143 RepID=A0A6A8G9U3_9EURY|nr:MULTISPECIES: sulfite oxidase [Haloferax]KAB1197817.1 sulfite oxidase [Haloferax sp. CBA1150]MRW96876.1 molybdopterin-dependent oxidoreductase [Haloferax marinum]
MPNGQSRGDEPAENDERDTSRRNRYVARRRFLMATGALAGVGVLAGCGGQTGETETTAPPTTTSTDTPTETPTETTEEPTETPEEPEEPSLEERYPGLEILSPEPENAQAASRSTYAGYLTPREEFYIRNHYVSPTIDESEWQVSLTGLVDSEVELSMEEIKHSFGTESVAHTMQCSGNGRAYFEPQVGGNQWGFGAVGNTIWTGTPLSEILDAYGADTSAGNYLSVMGGEAPEGEDIFTRSIPMEKVMEDSILAYEMNGGPLSKEHGFPVRLLVPGWYGNNNVKWVDRMHVMDTMVIGEEWETEEQRLYTHWQQYSYRLIPEQDDDAVQYESIDIFDTQEQMENTDQIRNAYMYDQLVKSLIGYPGQGQTVRPSPGGTIEVVGVAWAGDDAVETVEVSIDGGETWGEAEFYGPAYTTTGWRQFRYIWSDPSPGEHTLVSRATDEEGRTQPAIISAPEEGLRGIQDDKFPWNEDGYANNAYMPHAVTCTVEQ